VAIRFDLTSIPTTAVVSKAIMSFWCTDSWYTRGNTAAETNVHRASRAWEYVADPWQAWTKASASTNWSKGGGDYGASVAKQAQPGRIYTDNGGWYEYDITTAVQDMVKNPSGNNGFIITEDAGTDGPVFRSSHWTTAAQRPKMTVTYAVTTAVNRRAQIVPARIAGGGMCAYGIDGRRVGVAHSSVGLVITDARHSPGAIRVSSSISGW
jgi:hypothetical protein